jgi:pseudouridine-5'-phosphate glycosidase
MGVCVYTLNKDGSKEFPAFFTSKSGFEAPYNCRDVVDAAKLIYINKRTNLSTGMLIGILTSRNWSYF